MSNTRSSAKKKKEAQSRRVVDKFSLKTWYTVHAPRIFGEDEVAETPAADPEYVKGRAITTSMMDLTGDYKKMHVKLTFRVNDVKGDHAYTRFDGHEYTRDYLRSMVRRRRTRVDGIFNVITKDGAKVRVSVIALTPFRCKASHEHGIREAMFDVVSKRAQKMSFEKYVKDLIGGKLATEIYKRVKKIHPVQNVDIWKSKVANQPTIILTDEEEQKASAELQKEEEAEEKVAKVEEVTTDS
ncbi:MAG: 30S ribosomal protein S3ae [Candidatus Thorarchaeota archaeon]